MIRFALVVASVLGFVLTAALGNMMVPLLRELQRAARGTQPDSDAPDSPVPTMGGLCLMVGTLAAVGVGWLAACAAQPSLLGSDRQMTSRLLIAPVSYTHLDVYKRQADAAAHGFAADMQDLSVHTGIVQFLCNERKGGIGAAFFVRARCV